MSVLATQTFGQVLTAMVSPMKTDGELDFLAAEQLVKYLTRPGWNDGLIINGTTGESAMTHMQEKNELLERALSVCATTGVRIIAGVGSADTAHSVELAVAAQKLGADGLMIATPYYMKPSQQGIIDHVREIARHVDLPIMLYDIPGRSAVALTEHTIAELAHIEQVIALKDAKGDLESTAWVLRETQLSVYSGEDSLNLPLLALGACGVVSVAGHFVADRIRNCVQAIANGDYETARAEHLALLPVYRGIFKNPGLVSAKAMLAEQGLVEATVRLPMVELTDQQLAQLRADFIAGQVSLSEVASVI